MNRNYLKYILIGGVSIFVWTGCDDYLNRESTSGVNTPDLIWQNPKAITAVLADMYDSGLKLDEFDDWYGSKKANLANQTSLSDEATASYQKESALYLFLWRLCIQRRHGDPLQANPHCKQLPAEY